MSRIGKKPIPLPKGVSVTIEPGAVDVRGPKGRLRQPIPGGIIVEQAGSDLVARPQSDDKALGKFHGLTRSLVANAVEGVTNGFKLELDIVGVGYRAELKGREVVFALGYSHPIAYDAPDGISFEVPTPTQIAVRGIDKQRVGQVAAEIRALRKPEPYKGKGIRYENEHIIRKSGKSAAGG